MADLGRRLPAIEDGVSPHFLQGALISPEESDAQDGSDIRRSAVTIHRQADP